jgi:hypothetical protein
MGLAGPFGWTPLSGSGWDEGSRLSLKVGVPDGPHQTHAKPQPGFEKRVTAENGNVHPLCRPLWQSACKIRTPNNTLKLVNFCRQEWPHQLRRGRDHRTGGDRQSGADSPKTVF